MALLRARPVLRAEAGSPLGGLAVWVSGMGLAISRLLNLLREPENAERPQEGPGGWHHFL